MAEDADVRVLDGAKHPLGHLLLGLIEERMHAGDDDIHLGEDFVGEIERAVAEDVDFDAGKDTNLPVQLSVDLADALHVLQGAGVVEAVGHGQIFGVVGDGDVVVAAGDAGLGHFADGVFAVGGVRVHVHVAANVLLLDEAGQAMLFGRLDFAVVFAQLGRNPVQAEGGVDLFLSGSGDKKSHLRPGPGRIR